MARLASLAKAGYYPTPPRVTQMIANHLHASEEGGRLLDPCSGEGEAAALVANQLRLESYGIELDRERALQSSLVLNAVLHSDYQQVSIPSNSVGLLYLNPPYDTDAETKRLEYKFLTYTIKWLMPEGVLVYIVPRYAINVPTAVYLVSHFREIRVFQFPNPEYEQFKQIVLFGVKSEKLLGDKQKEAAALVTQCRLALLILPETCETPYHVPPIPPDIRFHFHSKVITPEEVLAEALKRGVWAKAEWRDMFQPLNQDSEFQPLMPLRLGHLAMLIAAGLFKNMELQKEGKRLLVKGRTTRAQVVSRDEENHAEITRFTPVPEILTLDLESGHMDRLDQPEVLSAFMDEWQQVIAEKVLQNFDPLYHFDYEEMNPEVADTLKKLSPHRRLAGRAETGLFETQKHVAVALWRRFLTESFALLLGEPGVGKTTIACAVAALLGEKANPTIVICPPHLVEKWKREIADVIPSAHVAALYRLSDVKRFVSDFKRLPDGRIAFAVVSKEMAKAGSGFTPAFQVRRRLVNVKAEGAQHAPAKAEFERWVNLVESSARPDAVEEEAPRRIENWEEESQFTPDSTVHPVVVLADKDTAWADEFTDDSLWDALYKLEREAREVEDASKPLMRDVVEYFVCPQCGQPLRATSRGQTVGLVQDPNYFEDKKRRCPECLSPLYQGVHLNRKGSFGAIDVANLKTTRYPIADYIKRKHKGFFKLLIADEAHQYKGQSTDQSYAFQSLVYACDRTLAMTGSIYGGRASSIFYLLHRLSSGIRDEYGWNEVQRWIEKYGVLEEIVKDQRDRDDTQVGVFSGKRRTETIVREGAGISPELVTRMLEYTAFVQLSDLGFTLPNFTEIPQYLNLAPDHRLAYDGLQRALKTYLVENRFNGKSQRLLGAYLQSLLGYPNAGFREEVVRDPDGAVVASAPALGEERIYPKEERLIQLVREARAHGRRVLVYCRQTSTRDITARLKKLLERVGVRAVVLTSQVNAKAREAWVHQQLGKGCDALITNMQLVETGLDLVDFPTLIFVEPHYSVYTMLQAARRSWRLGQVNDVEVYYLVHQNTMEHRAVGLIIEKLIASFLLNGDSVEGALLASSQSSDNFLKELAHNLTSGADVPDLQRLFQEKARKAQGATGALLLNPPPSPVRALSQSQTASVHTDAEADAALLMPLTPISASHYQQGALLAGE